MASTHKHIRSSTANKRPTTAIADGQIALNTNASSPGLFFKDSTGASIIKIGPVHVGSTAPNATPGAGGSSGNSTGETWLDNSLTPVGVKIWNGSAWVNATPVGSTTVQGLLELATSAETQTGTDTDRAVTPAGLQSKLSDSTSTTSSTTIASSTAVKAAYDLAAAALPLSGGIITGNLEIGTTGSLSFEGSTADAFETTIAVTDPTADRTITLPDTTGTIVTTGDTGTVTSTMILDGTILDVDVNASAAIAHSKLANITAASVLLGNASNVPTATALTGDVTVTSSGVTSISSGVIVNADVNASAAIAGTKISPDFGSQNTTTTGTSTAASFIPTSSTVPTNGVYLPAANSVAISTNGTGRLFIDSSGRVGVGTSTFAAANHALTVAGGYSVLNGLSISGADTANSIYQSGAFGLSSDNYITLGTGGSQTERLRITSAGLVGIGTSNPQTLFHIANTSDGTNGAVVRLQGAASVLSGGRLGDIEFWGGRFSSNTGKTLGLIRVGNEFAGTWDGNATREDTFMSFSTALDQTLNERLRITSAGNVGIGTTSPSLGLLEVSSTNGVTLAVKNTSPTVVGNEFCQLTFNNTDNSSGNFESAKIKAISTNGGANLAHLTFENSGTERARIDSSGRLLVGTSTARSVGGLTNQVQVEGVNAGTYSQSWVRNVAGTSGATIYLGKSRSGSVGGVTIVNNNDQLGGLYFAGADGVDLDTPGASIEAYVDGTPGANDMPGRLVFSTTADGASSPTERMRIANDGQMNHFSSGLHAIRLRSSSSAGTTNTLYSGIHSATQNSTSGTESFIVYTNGNVLNTNNSYGSLSDIKLKENITDATSQWSDIKALQVRKYNFKEETGQETHTQIGLVAQEVELVSPGLVSESPDRDSEGNDLGTVTKSVNYSVLYMKAVKALQEAMERIEQLEAEMAEVKAQLS